MLTLNNIFNYKNFKFHLQIKGCAMGTTCAPYYGNLFIASFESTFKYPYIKETVAPYKFHQWPPCQIDWLRRRTIEI